MFDLCYECGGKLEKQIGVVHGYWGDEKIDFINLPTYKCSKCSEFYLDQKIAIVTQEITRALSDINVIPKIVDISNSLDTLNKHIDEVYAMIVDGKIPLIKVDDKIIINNKDVVSLFYDNAVLMAARNKYNITDDVKKEISRIVEQEDEYKL